MSLPEAEMVISTGEALSDFQPAELVDQFRYKSGISGKQSLSCERVNEITFKITNGEMSRVPASFGKWGGYNTTKALAWVINIGISSAAWLARCGDKVVGPASFKEARAAALNLVKGAEGDYQIRNAISDLNGLQARLVDQGGVS
jgi:hypothetical protein